MQNMASGRTAEDSVLVLQTNHVDIVEVQKLSRLLIRGQVILSKRPSHARRVFISFVGVINWERQQSSCTILCGNGCAQVGCERGYSALPRKIIADHGDSAGQRWLHLRPGARRG